jgi:hypothetical protein
MEETRGRTQPFALFPLIIDNKACYTIREFVVSIIMWKAR